MAMTRQRLCKTICTKVGIVRKLPHKNSLSKAELLHVNSALDLVQSERVSGKPATATAVAKKGV